MMFLCSLHPLLALSLILLLALIHLLILQLLLCKLQRLKFLCSLVTHLHLRMLLILILLLYYIVPVDTIWYVPQASSLVLTTPSFRDSTNIYTLTAPNNDHSNQSTIRYTLQDSFLVSIPFTTTTNVSSQEPINTSSNYVSHNVHPMQTRPKARSMNALSTNLQPYVDLINSKPSDIYSSMHSSHKATVVREELNALAINNTWCLTTLPGGRIPIGCKWLFKIKRSFDGSIA